VRPSRALRRAAVLLTVWTLLSSSSEAAGQTAGASAPKPKEMVVTVCDASTLILRGETRVPLPNDLRLELFKLPDDWELHPEVSPTRIAETEAPCLGDCFHLRAFLDDDLEKDARYVAVLRGRGSAEPARFGAGSFKTTPEADLLGVGTAQEKGFVFRVKSDVALKFDGQDQPLTVRVKPKDGPEWPTPVPARLITPPREFTCDASPQTVFNPEVAIADVEVAFPNARRPPKDSKLVLAGLENAFGVPVTVSGKYVPSAPKTEKDAAYYASLAYQGSDDEPDSYGLDFKIAPAVVVKKGWQLGPRFLADVSRNADSPNAAEAGFFASHSQFLDGGRVTLSTWNLNLGAEGDRDLDRINGIFDAEWAPRIDALENSRELRRLAAAEKGGPIPEELPPTGWGIEPEIGVELGRALRTQTFRNTSTGQRLEVDTYDVLRPRIGVHAYFEWNRLILNVTSTLRYLAETELAARKADDGTLSLRRLDELEPYTEAKLQIAIDPAGHQVFEVAYENGAVPPVFERVDGFTIGLAMKY